MCCCLWWLLVAFEIFFSLIDAWHTLFHTCSRDIFSHMYWIWLYWCIYCFFLKKFNRKKVFDARFDVVDLLFNCWIEMNWTALNWTELNWIELGGMLIWCSHTICQFEKLNRIHTTKLPIADKFKFKNQRQSQTIITNVYLDHNSSLSRS